MKKPETLAEAFDLTKTHWRDIIEFLKEWYEENDREPEIELGLDDVPKDIEWFASNCGLCSFFREDGQLNCAPCPLGNCGRGSLYRKFAVTPTIANAELMLAEIERKENE